MLNAIRRLLSGPDRETGARADHDNDVRIATCAILMEIAHTDGVFSPTEEEAVVAALRNELDIPESELHEIMEIAGHELDGSIDLWRFTSRINEAYSIREKEQVMECIWRIALSDRVLDKHEDYLAHKLAELLRLDHRQLMEAKKRASRRPDPSGNPKPD